MNWYVHSTTTRCVGFIQDGNVCEGGNCEHLEDGDQAHGYSGEADSWGSEHYLMCKSCYDQFLIDRQTELVDCEDCGLDVPRNEGKNYTPYFCDELPRERNRIFVCNNCAPLPAHQSRLAQDDRDMEADKLEAEMNDNMTHMASEDDGADDPIDDDDIDVYDDGIFGEPLVPEEGEEPEIDALDEEERDIPFLDDEEHA
jgi:hypothetical protein